jgi:alpha-glucosidase
MRSATIIFLLLCVATTLFAADSLLLYSPDKKINVAVYYKDHISYTVSYNGQAILQPSLIDLLVNGKPSLTGKIKIVSVKPVTVDEEVICPVPEKRKVIRNHYNEYTVSFLQPYALLFRVYNDGVAYRFATRFKDSIIIQNEKALFAFEKGKKILLPLIDPGQRTDKFHTSFEELYQLKTIDSLTLQHFAYTPVLVGTGDEIKIAITESDLEDYPGMFLQGTSSGAIEGLFAPYPLQTKMTDGEFPQEVVTKRAGYIARTKGTRNFPWRVLMIAKEDKDLPGNDLVYRLAAPSKIKDASWISPGKGTDEWIIGINLFNVPFKAGINTATYKYYIDFAKQFGLQRIMMDAGWSNYKNLFDIIPSINMDTIAAYAKSKGIRLSMWTLCSTLDKQLDSALDQFSKWGVDFIMTDFMDRDDQPMVNFYERIAKACADKKIMIMFHGAYPPKGFNRTWPNNITREGVLGSEYNIWSDKPTPGHDVTLPFTRMLAGPMDYEPGILDNATKEQFRPIGKKVMSQGTRCHQLAMFVVYDSPIQIFSGNPSQGMMEPEFMKFLGEIPTTWDETKILAGKVGDYIVTARRKGEDWWIAGMTDWQAREVEFPVGILDEGSYNEVFLGDGPNATNYPSDYILEKRITAFESSQYAMGETRMWLSVKMAPGGGFVIKLSKKKN